MKFAVPALAALVFLGLSTLSGCGRDSSDNKPEVSVPGVPSGTGARVGGEVPDFLLKRIDGGTLQLSSLRGKAVLLDFWDTWCPPCRVAMPHLQEISTAYPEDLVVVGVAFGRQGEGAVGKFLRDNGLTFENVLADQKVVLDFGGLQSIPTTFLVDRNGTIVEKWVGGQSKATYENAVKAVLAS